MAVMKSWQRAARAAPVERCRSRTHPAEISSSIRSSDANDRAAHLLRCPRCLCATDLQLPLPRSRPHTASIRPAVTIDLADLLIVLAPEVDWRYKRGDLVWSLSDAG